MTTFSAYIDAIASQSTSSKPLHRHWLLSPAAQLTALYFIDAAVITVALLLAISARSLLPFDLAAETDAIRISAPILIGIWLVMLHFFGADRLRHLRAGATEYKRVVMASFSMAGLVGIGSYLLRADFPRGLYVLLFSIGTCALVLTRFGRRKLMGRIHRQGALMTPVMVAGDSGHVDAIAKVLRREVWLGYKVVGALTRDQADQTPGGLPVLGGLADTVKVIEEHKIATVIFAEGSFQSPTDFRRMAWQLEEHEIHMIVVPALTDVSAQRLEVRPVAGLPLVDVDRPQAIAAARWIKRTYDVIGASILLLLAAPLMAAVALAIKLEDGGPVIFRQARVGLKGQGFECLKFRSMVLDAEARLAELAAANEGSGPLFKMSRPADHQGGPVHSPVLTR